ncbi:hypothetical protein [Algoriphagus antarcticus]|uniref:Uncharacterized protein n=1 Tax=Algoriphagus antarcticus TaxID=238540 RepID=A0A3E0DIH5_9BACT|nr:hypothetical protein [Algoriphagus antarcticus]REG81258.1 hypothetical protein C8N25_12848 [Algoriphagus antarcticus]
MQDEITSYRQNIIDAIHTLEKCDEMIFNSGISLFMNNEWKDIEAAFEIGDVYKFSINHLETSADINVQLIAKTINEIRRTIDSLQNLNSISDDEVNQV